MKWIILAAAAASLPTQVGKARAEPSPAPPAPASSRAWQVNWGEQFCTLVRMPDAGTPYYTAIRTVPGSNSVEISLSPRGAEELPRGVTSITLSPVGTVFDVRAREESRGARRVLAIQSLTDDFWDALARAGELQLKAGGAVRMRIALADAGAGVRALHQCTAAVAREWGIDEGALRALSRQPATTNHFGLTADDYPAGAQRSNIEGRVVVRVTVSAAGRATACAVVSSSGNASIDAITCRMTLWRAHFTPGLDAAGRPVAVTSTTAVTWLLPG